MPDYREALRGIRTFRSLIKFLHDELDWPISSEDFEELTFDYTPEELGIDSKNAAKIQEIKRLRPLSPNQPWGIFFVKFEPKKLPVVALRRILSRVVLKKRASANSAERAAWQTDDLLFVSNYGEDEERRISLAHFAQDGQKKDLPTLKVLGWDNLDTPLHLDHVASELCEKLAWPEDEEDAKSWRDSWRSAFTLRHREVITTSKGLAVRLAELARAIRNRINTILAIETEDGPVTKLMTAFKEALIHDLDEDGFADMYAQTIAYGLLSARVENPSGGTADDFAAQMPATNPFLKELMETFLHVGGRKGKSGSGAGIDFDELGVSEVVELLDDTNMEAVVRDFGDRNPQEDPVIHFYELFLKEYDPKEKVRRGVFYTPLPVVSFIVRSVDELLRTEFGLQDGLADTATWGEMAERHEGLEIPDGAKPGDPFVQILDPATGTGTFLVEVIDVIHKTMTEKWKAEGHSAKKIEQFWNDYVPKHLLPRLHGYELLMAPYAIAHMKIGLKLYETGYRFGSEARARIYLTNALEPAQDFSDRLAFAIPALAHEAEAVNEIKRDQRFTVVIGNPPYSGVSSNMTEVAQSLVDRYRFIDGEPLVERKLWLQNDYVKFLGLAHQIILDTGFGCIGFITANSYLDGPTFRGVRSNLLNDFESLHVLNLGGSAKKKGDASLSEPDKNVFDITQGVAVIHAVCDIRKSHRTLHISSIRGAREKKYAALSSATMAQNQWTRLTPTPPFYQFVQTNNAYETEYSSFFPMKVAFPLQSVGVQTSRDHLAIGFTRDVLVERIRDFVSPTWNDNEIRERYFPGKKVGKYPAGDTRGWSLTDARQKLSKVKNLEHKIVPIHYRPFDFRWVFNSTLLSDWPRPEVSRQMVSRSNLALCILRRTENAREYDYFSVSRDTISNHQASLKDGTYLLPLYIESPMESRSLLRSDPRTPNLSTSFLRVFAKSLGIQHFGRHGIPQGVEPEEILEYSYAIFHSPTYRTRYAEPLKIDYPRLPLPRGLNFFRELIPLGSELISLHLMESPKLDDFINTYSGPKPPEVKRVGWSDNTVWLDAGKTSAREGHRASKPGTIGFSGVPEEVWDFHIGGYQVCHKWLKDRKSRTLSDDDIAHYQKIVVALAETIRIMGEIDEVIDQHGGWPDAFQTQADLTASVN